MQTPGTLATTDAADLEAVVRPLLAELARASGMESVYLTEIDWTAARQSIMYAHNDSRQVVTEGYAYPWSTALCRRALVDGPGHTQDAQGDWPEAGTARVLDLRTFISVPVYTSARPRQLAGTLCALSSDVVALGAGMRRRMREVADEVGSRLDARASTAAAEPLTEEERAEMVSLGEDLGRAVAIIEAQRLRLEQLEGAAGGQGTP